MNIKTFIDGVMKVIYQMTSKPMHLTWSASIIYIAVLSLSMDARKLYLAGADMLTVKMKQMKKYTWMC
jgi:hypothetical protein